MSNQNQNKQTNQKAMTYEELWKAIRTIVFGAIALTVGIITFFGDVKSNYNGLVNMNMNWPSLGKVDLLYFFMVAPNLLQYITIFYFKRGGSFNLKKGEKWDYNQVGWLLGILAAVMFNTATNYAGMKTATGSALMTLVFSLFFYTFCSENFIDWGINLLAIGKDSLAGNNKINQTQQPKQSQGNTPPQQQKPEQPRHQVPQGKPKQNGGQGGFKPYTPPNVNGNQNMEVGQPINLGYEDWTSES